jgi:DNA repair protein RecN (Recombination protein N)
MLEELRIENFAIIHELEIHFKDGLVIFTGETGAGKSIILDAINALVGGRVDATMVRDGADRASLEAQFKIPAETHTEIKDILKREDLDEGSESLTLAREIRMEGRAVARVNGRSVNVGLLKELGSFLVDIHGQSEHLSLLDVRSHLSLLDRYAAVENEHAEYFKVYRRLQEIRKELTSLRELEKESARRIELLNFQAQEIETAHLKQGEEEELDKERSRLANAESLSSSAQQAIVILDEGGPDVSSAGDLLGQAQQLLNGLARTDPSQQGLADQIEQLNEQIADLSGELRNYLEKIEFNPRRLEQVEERLEVIHQLKRKYGGSVDTVVEYGRNARVQLETIANASERIAELEEEEKNSVIEAKEKAAVLSEKRRSAAGRLSAAVENELTDLNMKGALFSTSFKDESDTVFMSSGTDVVEFLISPNPGEGLKPLVKIASGGETSRLMLALKNVLAQADFVPTLIFDEIDQGIGGRVGFVVGQKLWQLGRNHQVMCVTHLSQLASFGDQHYKVRKQVTGDRTTTEVEELEDTGRIVELAQMNGSMSESNLTAAQEALTRARELQGKPR